MNKSTFEKIQEKRFNQWGKREPLVDESNDKFFSAYMSARQHGKTSDEISAFFLMEFTQCQGFEFVCYSNAILNQPLNLGDQVFLWPCFLPSPVGYTVDNPKAQAFYSMKRLNSFVYDGFVVIERFDIQNISRAIAKAYEVISTFTILTSSKFRLEPKYNIDPSQTQTHYLGQNELGTLTNIFNELDGIEEQDRYAIFRSIAWLAEGLNASRSEVKFLLYILAIESLATYIEQDCKDDSALAKLRTEKGSKQERKRAREDCIKQRIENNGDINLTKLIQDTYFECVVGIKKRMSSHIYKLWGSDDADANLFIGNNVSLYQLRHTIAHGGHHLLSSQDKAKIDENVHLAEKVAIRYVWTILHKSYSLYNDPNPINASIPMNLASGAISNRNMYAGPVDMDLLYALGSLRF